MLLSIAFKEWAAICRALAEGRQSLILRKGGIAEEGGQFRPEHDRFLLYPTHFHEQHRVGIKPNLLPMLETVEREKPSAGTIRFTHFAEVVEVFQVLEVEKALALNELHGWTAEEVTKRFHYRKPGLFVLAVRVFRLPLSIERAERPEYAGCKSWVALEEAISIEGASAVLDREAFAAILSQVKAALT